MTQADRKLIGDVLSAATAADGPARHLFEAQEREIASCMAKQGFTYEPQPYAPLPLNGSSFIELSAEEAANSGYGDPATGSGGAASTNPNDARAADPAWYKAFGGNKTSSVDDSMGRRTFSTNGCAAEARVAVYGGKPGEWTDAEFVIANATGGLVSEALHAERFGAVDKKWSACMRSEGFEITSVKHAAGVGRGLPRSAEIEQAVVDQRCRASTGLERAFTAAYERAVAAHFDDLRATFTKYLSMMNAAEKRLSNES